MICNMIPDNLTDQETITVQIKPLPGNEDLPLPGYYSDHAAGMDVHAAVAEVMTLQPREILLIPCGFALAVPVGYEAQVRPRSGLAAKHGISMPNTPGTIDADYRGQVMVPLINLGQKPFDITRGMRIAQMVIKPVPRTQWKVVSDLPPSTRGQNGFGHTGQ
jgi:dUTP pyrophosphatase